jgi:alanine racemase
MQRVTAEIDLAALTHNYAVIQQQLGASVGIMPMIKANAYGHGLLQVASTLKQAQAFGVATLKEAEQLRSAGITQSIFVMCGFSEPAEIGAFVSLNLTAVLHHADQVAWLSEAKLVRPLHVWLAIDTGMHRLGISSDEFESIYAQLLQLPQVVQPIGLMTHFANADIDADFTQQQIAVFQSLAKSHAGPISLANSAGLLGFPSAHGALVRPGILLYGVSPFQGSVGAELGLKPVMRLTSRLIAYKKVRAGESVGYGCAWRATEDCMIGVVTVGYGDGYPRHLPSGTPVMIKGKVCPLVGRVSMDLITVDISALTHVQIGESVLLWGVELPVEHIAQYAETISYELLCQLTDRVTRV